MTKSDYSFSLWVLFNSLRNNPISFLSHPKTQQILKFLELLSEPKMIKRFLQKTTHNILARYCSGLEGFWIWLIKLFKVIWDSCFVFCASNKIMSLFITTVTMERNLFFGWALTIWNYKWKLKCWFYSIQNLLSEKSKPGQKSCK